MRNTERAAKSDIQMDTSHTKCCSCAFEANGSNLPAAGCSTWWLRAVLLLRGGGVISAGLENQLLLILLHDT